jgi:acetyl esterase
MDWFRSQYFDTSDPSLDPRASPLRAPHLGGLPPAYVATAGFDVLRDEGEQYAHRLRDARGDAQASRLVHGFATDLGAGQFAVRAMAEAVGALRAAVSGREN